MRLTQQAIDVLKGNTDMQLDLAKALGVGQRAIEKQIQFNTNEGKLTTKKALNIISSRTGLSEEEILTEEKTN